MRQHALKRSVCRDQARRSLGPDAGHARHVVDRVPHQREHVHDLRGTDSLGLEELLRADVLPRLRIEERDVPVVEELREVLVLAHDPDPHVRICAPCLAHERGDDVVGLNFLERIERDAGEPRELHAPLRLGTEVLGWRIAVSLVLRVDLRPEGATVTRGVHNEHEMRGMLLRDQLQQHADEAVRHLRGLACDGTGHPAADGVVRAEELRVPIDDVQR